VGSLTSSGLASGDSVSGGSFAFTNRNAGTGKTVTTSGATINDGNSGNNYAVAYADNTTSTINKASLTLGTSDVVKTYDGSTSATGALTSTGLATGDSVSGASFAFTSKNAGTGNKTVTTSGATVNDGNSGNNYTVAYADNTTSTINKASLTLTTSDVVKTYDGTTSATGSLQSFGLVSGDSVSGGSFAFTNRNAGIGNKTVTTAGATINDGNSGNNYAVIYANNTTSTINKAILTLGTSNVIKTYDGNTSAAGSLTSTGLVGGDNVSGGAFAFTNKNAGTGKTVITSGVTVNDGNSGNNYAIAYAANTSSTINKANLALTTSDVIKTYDGNTSAAGTLASTGLAAGDTLAGGTFAFTDKNAGTGKTVTTSGVTVNDGNNGNNYNVSYVNNNNSTINKASLIVTTTGADKVYDATTAVTVTYGYNPLAGDVVTVTGTAAFVNKDVAPSVPINVTGLSASGTNAGNYNLVDAGGASAAIKPKMLAWTLSAGGPSLIGFVPGESPLSLTNYNNYSIRNSMPAVAAAYPVFNGLPSLLNPFLCSVPSLDRLGGDPINAVADCTQQSGIGAARQRLDEAAADDDQ
jgi:hypothetical protein